MSLLTITIPTYNRAEYLKESLGSLVLNNIDFKKVEILVLDNDSKDNTQKIVEEFQQKIQIKYIKNEMNIGPDENFKKCLTVASSEYVWIFGDDDIFFPNSIEFITNLLSAHKGIGVVHLRAENFIDVCTFNMNYKEIKYELLDDPRSFIKMVHTNITFLSANIVNKKYIFDNVKLSDISNNNLGQVYWTLVATIKSKQNVFVSSKLIGARQYNSGNYNFCEVFGNNFMEILYTLNKKYDIKDLISIFKKRLLIIYFPANIVRLRNGLSEVKYESCLKIFLKNYKKDVYFWLFTFPAIVLPKKIALSAYEFAEKIKMRKNSSK